MGDRVDAEIERILAEADKDGDGQIDLSDAVFNQLRVWVDADTDGTTDAGEPRTLAALLDAGGLDALLIARALVAAQGVVLHGTHGTTTACW